ncbi:carboxypeptidase regulatory-like domain-containing protein [Steroidobacter sp. S1-65]|uniref:Carboxypeptidase regulatory-like domain-containing protein n=1 Tax=Steroidobacter gossypii TaxID=2805490 RepID=A0ABS1WYE7_9GAMM|nr:SdrD B-like domain-containing protein [Steroidobacter gossypii]MBM0106000.1 carboxypeptidase regulatory-like domain-containing protein [Steroidobacter gossypii]
MLKPWARMPRAGFFWWLSQATLLAWLAVMFTAGAVHATPLIEVLTLQDSVDPVPAGGELTYSVQVSNVSSSTPATGVSLTVALPAGTTFVSTDNASCSHSSGTVTCSFGTFPAEHDVLFDIVTRVTAAGGTTLTAVATATGDGETPSTLEQETTVMNGADLTLSMGATPDPVAAGGDVTYTLSVQNEGPDASSNLQIVDTLPPNMTYVSSSGAGWSCSPAGSTVTCNRSGTLANGASSVLTIIGRVQNSLSGSLTNSATLSADTADGVPNNNTATASVNVIAGADLTLTKLASPTPMISAAPATFTLQPRNAGPDPAADVTVVDTLPTGFTAIAASGSNWSCSVDQATRLVTCTRASMPVGASDDITITATAPDDTVVPPGGMTTSNTANVTGATSDPDNGNNDGSVDITIQRDGADMSIQKSKSPNPVAAGSPLTSVMQATNNGPRALDADDTITIIDTLAAGESYAGASPFTDNGWTCTYSAPAFTCSRPGPLAVGQTTPQLTLITTAAAPTSLTNTACVALAGSQTDPNNTNDCASANSSSTAAHGDLRITKTQNLSTVTATDTSITYTLTIANDGPQDSANVVVRDVIPMRTTVVAGTPTVINASAGLGSKGSAGNCSVAAQVVTCDYPTLLFESAGTGAPNTPETAVITITVARPMADGAFTNTATITSTNVGDPDHADNTSSVNTTVEPVVDVQVEAKTVTPSAVEAGVNATYVITFSNRGPSTAQDVTLTDQFNLPGGDAGYEVISITASKGTCNPHDPVAHRIDCNIGTLAANEAQTVQVVVRPIWMASPPMGRNLPNTATIATTTFDSDASNDARSATLDITAAEVDLISNVSDVSSFVGVTADPLAYDGGAPDTNLITYRVTVSNLGPSEATSVDFVNTFTPPGGRQVTFLCDSSDPLSCAGTPICSSITAGTVIGTPQQVTCAAGDMEAGSSFTRYLRYRVETAPGPTGDAYQSAVTVDSNENEPNTGNNNAQEPTAVRAKADLQVSSKTALISSPPLQYGQEFQWRIVVANNGPGTAYQTTLTDTLPAHMVLTMPFTAVVTPSGSCTNTGNTQFSCDLGDMLAGAGQERTITVNVRIDRPASPPYPSTYSNTASVTTTYSVDPISSNNSNSGSVSLVKSSIAGTVYRDNDNDGVLEAGEGGIAGVSLTLTGQDVFGNAVTRSATTDASGNYIFDNLEQSNATGYTITQSQPAGYSDGLETAGVGTGANPPGGVVSAAPDSQTISNIVLDKDQIASGYNFGELRLNSLAGRVFADVDNDGVFDTGAISDRALQDVEITLTGTDVRGGAVNLVTNTDSTGNYTFSNVLPGSYRIIETQPVRYLDGVHTAGTPAGDISVNDEVALDVTDQDGTGYNFGEQGGTISGRVWRDANRDGVLDAGEVGINNVTVTLTQTDPLGSFTLVTTTNATGNYSFYTVPAGTFTITESQPAGFGSTTPNSIAGITIAAGGSSTDHNFGDSTSALQGTVFFDRDGNGANGGSDTGIAGVTLALTGTNAAGAAVNLSTTTGADGTFSFDDLLAPNGAGYTLTQTQPVEFANGQITAGSAAGTVNQGANRVSAIALTSGTIGSGYLFAELGTPISGVVYRDANRNGVKEASEPGIANVTIRLRDAGDTVIATTTTAANGTYSFAPQPGGSYTVEQDQPAGFSSGPENVSNSVALALVAGTPGVVDFGESTGSLSGVVFIDVDEDGVQDAEDVGVPGVTLTLTGTDALGSAVNRNVVTNASGLYVFNDLLSGTYTITETQPASLGDGLEVLGAGNVGGTVGNDVYSAISLPVGEQATGYNFGESGSAVTGVVFRDFNRDGVQQAGDTAIENVTITLRDASNNVVATTTTAADGSYMIAGIPAGNYTVVETQPAGYGSAATSPDTVAVVVPTNGVVTASFADTLSTLAGAVYIDLNSNGVRDAGEAGIASITVTLTGTDASGASVSRSVGTDSTGAFMFIDLLTPTAAGYTLTQPTQPSAFADGLDTAGTAGGSVANDVITGIHLAVNTDATGYWFGEGASTIGGVVFKDVNANGTRDGGDTPIANVVIVARDVSNTVVATTTTDASGAYTFVGLPAGNYTIEETQPAGYGSSTPNSVSVTVNVGSSATADFGETTSSIAGFVWTDTNNNGVRDAGEPPIAGVAIALTGTDASGASISLATTTDATGAFQFVDLLSGTYSLSETQPAAYADGMDVAGTAGGTVGNDVISAIALPAGTDATGYAFAEMGQAVVGRVWRDSDRDGVLGSSEAGIAAVTITLRSNGSIIATTTTDADGNYSFVNIPAGQYTVEETQPAGYGSSTPDSVNVELIAGVVAPNVNFGDTVGSIVGRVYNDANNNGRIDAGEPGIADVAIQLTGTDARGNNVLLSASTDRDGRYRFDDVVGGTYALTETQPTGYQDGTNTAGTAGGAVAGDTISAIALGAQVDAADYLFGERGDSASIVGHVWRDADHDRIRESGEAVLADWIVELYQGTLLVQSVRTNADGAYEFSNVASGSGYEIRFREPSSNSVYGKAVTNESGVDVVAGAVSAANPGGADPRGGTLLGIILPPGSQLIEQSLPLDPMGVVYDSVSRQPIAGATVTLRGPSGFDPALHLLGGASNITQVTGADGFYQFLLLTGAPSGDYSISVTPPSGRYMPGPSTMIPVCPGILQVGAMPDPALVQSSVSAPAIGIGNVQSCPSNSVGLAAGVDTTQYFLAFNLTPGTSADVINNHVPVDPILQGAIVVTKTTPMINVTRGDLVPYTITATNMLNATLTNVDVRDLLPPGFAYRSGTASLNGAMLEPERVGRQLTWRDQTFAPSETKTFKLVLVVGSGVSEGEYVNQAFALNNLIDPGLADPTLSNVATAAVRIVPDPVFDCSDLIGKVFDDRNANGYQDPGEPGLPNVRVVTLNGIIVTADADGRFHVACAAIPNEYRGSNFVMKLDERTLPSGYRVTTENPRDVRLTRGKLTKLNFGATIHRVVRVEVTDEAFEPGSTTLRAEWRERLSELPKTLADKPSVVRVSYAGDEDAKLVKRRKQTLIRQIREQWEALHREYPLHVEDETEVQP